MVAVPESVPPAADPRSTSPPIMFRTSPILATRRPAPSRGRAPIARRTRGEISAIAAAGEIVAAALDAGRRTASVGTSTAVVAESVEAVLESRGAEAVLRSEFDFPAACCTSVNETVIHGVPSDRALVDGDLLSIDVACRFDGWCADAAITVPVGEVDAGRTRLVAETEATLQAAIAAIRPGRRWSEVARELQERVERSGFATITGWTGHGVGREVHEAPAAPATLTAGLLGRGDFTLLPGMVLAVEPVLVLQAPPPSGGPCLRGVATVRGGDAWSVETASGVPACHVEHTIAVTTRGAEVLTTMTATREGVEA
jgi:methionyl aminopeptidase